MAKQIKVTLAAHTFGDGMICRKCRREADGLPCPGYITAADTPGMTWRKDDHTSRGGGRKASGKTARRAK